MPKTTRHLKKYGGLIILMGYTDSPFFYGPTKEQKVLYAPFFYRSQSYLEAKKLLAKHKTK